MNWILACRPCSSQHTPHRRPALLVLAAVLLLLAAACVPIQPTPVVAGTAAATRSVEPTAAAGVPTRPATAGVPESTASPASATPAAEAGRPVIQVVRSGGIAGRTAQWTVYEDGRVVGPDGSKAVPAGQVAALLSALDTLGFFTLNDTYAGDGACRDCFNYDVTVTYGGRSKTIHVVEGATGVPAEVSQLLGRINQLIAAAG